MCWMQESSFGLAFMKEKRKADHDSKRHPHSFKKSSDLTVTLASYRYFKAGRQLIPTRLVFAVVMAVGTLSPLQISAWHENLIRGRV